nr:MULTISPECIES: TlpA disulfide reductase family protein [unclassified Streptomyces]
MIQSPAPRGRGARRRSLLAATGFALSALVLTACAQPESGAEGGSDGSSYVEGSGMVTEVPPEDRLPAPDLTGITTHDEPIALSDYAGQVVVLNVWGSWCAPCRAEAPNLAKLAEETADQDVQFVGINVRDHDAANARSFDRSFGIDYPSFFDPKGRLILEFPANTLSPQGIPSTLVLDREGRIAVRAVKALTEEELRSMIEPIVAEGTAGEEADPEGDAPDADADAGDADGDAPDADAGAPAEGATDDD